MWQLQLPLIMVSLFEGEELPNISATFFDVSVESVPVVDDCDLGKVGEVDTVTFSFLMPELIENIAAFADIANKNTMITTSNTAPIMLIVVLKLPFFITSLPHL